MWEMRFYLMVAFLVFVFGRNMKLGFLVWLGFEAATMGGLLPMTSFSNPIVLEFMYGVGIGLLVGRVWTSPAPTLTLVLGVLGLLAAGFYTAGDATTIGLTRMYVYGLPAALGIYGLLSIEARGGTTPVDTLGWLGDISYSLYLWHFPIFVFLNGYWWSAYGEGMTSSVGYALCSIVVTLAVSAVSFYGLERPVVRFANSVLRGRPHRTVSPLVGLPQGAP